MDDNEKIQKLIQEGVEKSKEAAKVSNGLMKGVREVDSVAKGVIAIDTLLIGIADFVSNVCINAGHKTVLDGFTTDAKLGSNALAADLMANTLQLIHVKLAQAALQAEEDSKNSPTH